MPYDFLLCITGHIDSLISKKLSACPSDLLLFCGGSAKQHGTLPTVDACAYEFTMVK